MEKLSSSYVVPGRILWLPAKKDLPPNCIRAIKAPKCHSEIGFDMPVVVLSRPADDCDIVHFHCITSFGGSSIEQRFGKYSRRCRSLRSTHVPIRPPAAFAKYEKTENELPPLILKGDSQIPRNSYVNTREVYSIDWLLLKPQPGSSWSPQPTDERLSDKSFNALLRHSWRMAGYLPGPQQTFQRTSIQLPHPAHATPWKPPPVPIKPYPALFLDDSKPRPILSVVIPGANKEIMSSKRSEGSQTLVEEPDSPIGCIGGVTLMFSWAGNSFARAWDNMRSR